MGTWIATLTNGETIAEANPGTWRELHNYCIQAGHKLRSLTVDGKPIDVRRALSYFIIYDRIDTVRHGCIRVRRGIGSFRVKGKARIEWKTLYGGDKERSGDYAQIVPADLAEGYNELAIEVEKI